MPTATWHTMPRDQGQIVTTSYIALGEAGCLSRRSDASDPTGTPATYEHAAWPDCDEPFEPWNGKLGGIEVGDWRPVTEAEAMRMVRRAAE